MNDAPIAQDPRELFDVVRYDGSPTGLRKARADVHRDGDWHRALHVWIVGVDAEGSFLLFQRRGRRKDTWPLRLDATVGGHYRAGETLAAALREAEEEIGLVVAPAELRPLGRRYGINESAPGLRDHEIQDVFLVRRDHPLTAYTPHPAELEALVRLPLPALLDLLSGRSAHITAVGYAARERSLARLDVTAADFIPTLDRYFYRVAIAAGLVLRGERDAAV